MKTLRERLYEIQNNTEIVKPPEKVMTPLEKLQADNERRREDLEEKKDNLQFKKQTRAVASQFLVGPYISRPVVGVTQSLGGPLSASGLDTMQAGAKFINKGRFQS